MPDTKLCECGCGRVIVRPRNHGDKTWAERLYYDDTCRHRDVRNIYKPTPRITVSRVIGAGWLSQQAARECARIDAMQIAAGKLRRYTPEEIAEYARGAS